MLPVLPIGGLALPVPGLVVILGLWIGLALAERQASKYGINPTLIYNLAFTALVAGVIGARLAYVVRFPEVFLATPLNLFSRNLGLLDLWGGIATAILAGMVYGQRKKLALWPTLDALTPALAVFAIALGLSNLASGAAFGAPSSVPWAIELWGDRRHPVQVYETLAAGLILWAVWPGRGLFTNLPAAGVTFLTFVALSAAARLFLEAFRGDSLLLPGGLRTAQVLAWLVLAASLWGLSVLRRMHRQAAEGV